MCNLIVTARKCFVLVLVTYVLLGTVELPKTASASSAAGGGNKLLLILLDGFRWDYLDTLFEPTDLQGFRMLRENGVQAESLKPDFPSVSYVNYYSAMTGLHAESHGMIYNYMYDPVSHKRFLIGENEDQYLPFWWKDGDPLWVTAAKQGKTSYMWYWPGCEVEIRGQRPTFCAPYQQTPNPSFEKFASALDSAVHVLSNGSADIAAVFLEQVDHNGHKFGPTSYNLTLAIRMVDAQLLRLQQLLRSTKFSNSDVSLDERVDLMIFADHGMTAIKDPVSGLVYVDETIFADSDVVIGSTFGPFLQVYTRPSRESELYDRLKNLHPNVTVYRKADIPDRFYFKTHYRIPPLILLADEGYVLYYESNATTTNIGYHGYDNELPEMHGIFFASGPDFKKKFRLPTIPNVDLYQIMCHVLGITPSPHNGTWSDVSDMLVDSSRNTSGDRTSLSASLLLLLLLLLTASLIGRRE